MRRECPVLCGPPSQRNGLAPTVYLSDPGGAGRGRWTLGEGEQVASLTQNQSISTLIISQKEALQTFSGPKGGTCTLCGKPSRYPLFLFCVCLVSYVSCVCIGYSVRHSMCVHAARCIAKMASGHGAYAKGRGATCPEAARRSSRKDSWS